MDVFNPFFQNFLLFPFLTAFIFSFISTPFVIRLARYFELVDNPKVRKHPAHVHSHTIPRAGGLAIYFGIIISVILFFPFSKQLLGIVGGMTALIFIGLLDDKFDLNPYFRLVTNCFAALLVIGSGISIAYITNPFGGIIHFDTLRIKFNFFGPHSIIVWADLLALIWIVWCMNMVNWSKGVDGQMPGFTAISAFILGILAFRFAIGGDSSQWFVVVFSFIAAGAFSGFIPFNFYPQRVMPGYGGGSLAGFILAILAILSGAKLATAILVLGVPMVDACYTIARRMFSKRSPVWADRGHLHHKLMDLGWGKRRIALFYWLLSAILGAVSLNLNSRGKFFAIVLVGVLLGGVLLWLSFWATFSRQADRNNG
ncbi:undecaprenyl/decaprenyl-phosphate alpha-N-acetylglucosaminyl 1-phosphate transferase [Candidatus Microgenomates bacterium]|nr:undecaprenyl/decaprenyl-phosphate alpha-N-acetylglucosaminyl 1-phosphate transferase [Candidatus Microgenomates bacterium]